MSVKLNTFQIQLLIYFFEADIKKRTVTDASRFLGKSKVFITRQLDNLEKLGIIERTETRKTVLTIYGHELAERYSYRLKMAQRYMQYQDLNPLQAKDNAISMLSAGFSDEFYIRMQEQEERLYVKELFADNQEFDGAQLCRQMKDGNYYLPFVIYREHIKNGNNISISNNGFEHPCELAIKDHIGTVYLSVKTIRAPSARNGIIIDGKVKNLQYKYNNTFIEAKKEGKYICLPAEALQFISMGNGKDRILHGSVCLKMQCSAGIIHMPVSTAMLNLFIL